MEKQDQEEVEASEEVKQEAQRMERKKKKKEKDPEKFKAIFSSELEQSIMPEGVKINAEPPEQSAEIEYVYGFRSSDARMNLRYNTSGNPVFMSAALGIILDKTANTQKIFGGIQTEMVPKN